MSTTSTAHGLPFPAGAVRVEPWYHPDKPFGGESNGEPGSRRFFVGREWTVQRDDEGDVRVSVDGEQTAEGTVERFIVVDGDPFTPGQARDLADALRAAADEADLMAQRDPAVTR
ncbi:hypothetical protein [Mycolicibacterium elephantis]|uniref:Uncharacterized protein n=1 Tax=Mycolicibacterium elephantis DSM 44368 TaxID=1335622 RepID=A0A439DPR1_9MYCO|nr:hypothetical protein [Mycolicibacterium elephantis]MCV7219854.1 hypothetical protein [Mycolicibacterium elephantis]RWA17592.1 hypothetical protein MELE44368_05450 [Mycolicibacterium elephantis DSM 44368]